MRFLSKLAFLCNLCFIVTVIMQIWLHVENAGKRAVANNNGALRLNPFESSVAVLGTVAIFINLFFIILFVARFPGKKFNNIQRWIVYFNMIMLPAQIYYFFWT